MSTRLEKIASEIKNNSELTDKCRIKLKPVREEIAVLNASDVTEDSLARLTLLKSQLVILDKELNKLRSDFYFLNAEKKNEEVRLKA